MKLAAAGALSCCIATSALAGSVTQPGETVGLAAGAPLPQGLYFVNTGDWGNRSGVDTSLAVLQKGVKSFLRIEPGRCMGAESGGDSVP